MKNLLKTFKPQVGNENHIQILRWLKKYDREKTPGRKVEIENRIKYLIQQHRLIPFKEVLVKEMKLPVFKKAFKRHVKKVIHK